MNGRVAPCWALGISLWACTPQHQQSCTVTDNGDGTKTISCPDGTSATLHDGLRYREIRILVSSHFETKLLSRAEAGERGDPYRDLRARTPEDSRAPA